MAGPHTRMFGAIGLIAAGRSILLPTASPNVAAENWAARWTSPASGRQILLSPFVKFNVPGSGGLRSVSVPSARTLQLMIAVL